MKIFVAIPAYDCKVHVGTAQSLASEAALALAVGIGMKISFQPGMSLVHAARNLLCADFLDSDCTHLVFVDADCGWTPGAILRLVMHGQDIVAGACRKRCEPEGYAINWLPDRQPGADGLIEVAGVGMAFTCVTRAALETFKIVFHDRAYGVDGRKLHGFFDSPVRGGSLWGEDMAFCDLVRKMGWRVFIDPSITLQHLEGMTTYEGNLAKWLNLKEAS